MYKLIILYLFLSIVLFAVGIINLFFLPMQIQSTSFGIQLHISVEIINIILAFIIFLKANSLYNKNFDKRMAIIGGGFLAGSILETFHTLSTSSFPYDVITVSSLKNNYDYLYLLVGDPIYAISIFIATFYISQTPEQESKRFRKRVYTIFLTITGIIIISNILFQPILLSVFEQYANKLIFLDSSIEVAEKALYILASFIYADIRLICKQRILSKFILGLFVLGIGQLAFITPNYITSFSGIVAHLSVLLGFTLIFLGINDIQYKPECVSFRQKLSAYLSLFLIISYLVFVTLSSLLFNFSFPSFSPYIFLEFFIITTIIQYTLTARLIRPITNILKGIEIFKPGTKPEKILVTSNDELGRLTTKINEITDLNWKYTQELLLKQKQDNIRFSILNQVRSNLNPNEVLYEVVNSIGQYFNPEECMIYNYEVNTGNVNTTEYEYRKNNNIPSLKNLNFQKQPGIEFIYDNINRLAISVVPDTQQDNLDASTKKFFENYGIKSALVLPLSYKGQILGVLALHYFTKSHFWSNQTIELLKSLDPQISIAIYQAKLFESTNVLAKRESSLRRIINLVLTSLDINDVFQTVSNEVGTLLNLDKCVLRLYNSQNETFEQTAREYRSDINIPSSVNLEYPKKVSQFFSQILYKERRPIIINDIDNSDLDYELREFIKSFGIKSLIGIPIFHKDEPVAVLFVMQVKYERKWSKEDIDILIPIADQVSIAIYQSQLFTTTKKSAEREQILRKIVLSSISSLDIRDILQTIVLQTGQLFKADRCFFVGYDTKDNKYLPVEDYAVYLSSVEIKDISGKKFTNEEFSPFTRITIEQKQVLTINDINQLELPEKAKEFLENYYVKSVLSAPVFYRDTPLGVLTLHFVNNYKKFSSEEIETISAISNQSAIVLHQAQLYNEIQETSTRERLLRTIINEVLNSDNLDTAVLSITKEVNKLFDADRTSFRFFNELEKNFSEVIGEYRKNEDIQSAMFKGGYTQEVNEYLIKKLISPEEIIIIDNIDEDGYPEPLRITFKNLGVKSTIIAPVFYLNKLIGIIVVSNIKCKKIWNRKNIDLLGPVVQQISIGIHLFSLNDRLSKALNNETILRETITEIGKYNDHNQVFNYLLSQLSNIFNVDRCLHLHLNENLDLDVLNEYKKYPEQESLLNQTILCRDCMKELVPSALQPLIIVNNICTEIINQELRDYLKSKNIYSFMIYPTTTRNVDGQDETMLGTTMICSSRIRNWSSEEKDLFRLVIETVSIAYLEIKQRQEVEEIRRTFIATLTHDLRSPIIAEQKALEFIIKNPPETQLGNFIEYLQDLYKTNQELLRIVNNILSVYHYESGKWELNLEAADITELIKEAEGSLKYLAKDKDSEIIINIPQNLPLVMIDKSEISRVISNLISNAIKHTRKGTKITITGKSVNNDVEISVSDNGMGIPEKEIANIFQRYPTTKRKIGTGLGLYLSKQIVEAHHGKIWFITETGKGTTFIFTVPKA